ETAGDGQHGDGKPEADESARGLNAGKPANRGRQCSQAAGQQHQRGKRPAVNRGTFHQCPDDPQVVRRPVRFHGVTLYYKVKKSRLFSMTSVLPVEWHAALRISTFDVWRNFFD